MELTQEKQKILTKMDVFFDLEDNEEILEVLQRNRGSYYAPRLFRGGILLIVYFALRFGILFEEIQRSSIFTNIMTWFLILWGVYFVISLLLGNIFVKGHVYIITTKRIVLIRKFLGIMFREIEYKRITDLVLHQPFWGRIFNFGNLMPVTAGVEMNAIKMGTYSIEGINDVFQIRNLVINQIQKIQKQILEEYHQIQSQKDSTLNSGDFAKS